MKNSRIFAEFQKRIYSLIIIYERKFVTFLMVIHSFFRQFFQQYHNVKPPKIEPIESSYSEIQKRKQKKEERYIRETNGVGQNYILGERFQS